MIALVLAAGCAGSESKDQADLGTDRVEQFLSGTPFPKLPTAELLEEVRKLQQVDGEAVGYGGGPGPFCLLSRELQKRAKPADFRKWADDPNVFMRAMGLVCLAQVDPQAAVPVLRSRLGSRAAFLCFYGGCCGDTESEGGLALSILRERAFLTGHWTASMLPEDEMVALDLEVLATDRFVHLRREPASHLHFRLTKKDDPEEWPRALTLRVADVQRMAAKMPLATLLRGLGRIEPCPQARRVLVAFAKDESASPLVRLTAASALTRDADDLAYTTLRQLKDALDRLAPGNPGSRFVAQVEARRDLAKILADLEKRVPRRPESSDDPWRENRIAALRETLPKILANRHPLAISDAGEVYGEIAGFRGAQGEDPDLFPQVGRFVLATVERLLEFRQPWDTYSDLPWVLNDALLDPWISHRAVKGLFDEDEAPPPLKTVIGEQRWEGMARAIRDHMR
jgi:hypothetical protein